MLLWPVCLTVLPGLVTKHMIPLLLVTHLVSFRRTDGATGVFLFKEKTLLKLLSTLSIMLSLSPWNLGLLHSLKHLGTPTFVLRLTLPLVLVNGSRTTRVVLPLMWAPFVFTTLTTMVMGSCTLVTELAILRVLVRMLYRTWCRVRPWLCRCC